MRLPVTFMLFAMLAEPLDAGAWMRDKGSGFFSYSASATRDGAVSGASDGRTQSLYAEFGLSPKLTFGANAWQTDVDGAGYFFFRYPLSSPKASRKLAVEVAIGAFKASGKEPDPAQRFGFSVGRGFATGLGPGWMQFDTSYEYRAISGTEILKAEATVGVSYRTNRKAMMQVFAEQTDSDPVLLTLSPSYLRRVAPNAHLVLGADYEVAGGNQVGLRLGTWLEF